VTAPPGSDEPTEAGTAVDFRSCDIAEIVRQGVALASEASPSVVVDLHAPPTLPAAAEAEAVGGVIRLLVDAACRRSEAGVTVRVRHADEGITVQVVDRGPGLDRHKIASAFSGTIAAGEVSADEDRSMAGLGLARALIAIHGGILWAEPLPAGGNRVAFTIPESPVGADGDGHQVSGELRELLSELAVLSDPPAAEEEQPEPGPEYLFDNPGDETATLEVEIIADLAAAEQGAATESPSQVLDRDTAAVDTEPPVATEPLEGIEHVDDPDIPVVDAIEDQPAEMEDEVRPHRPRRGWLRRTSVRRRARRKRAFEEPAAVRETPPQPLEVTDPEAAETAEGSHPVAAEAVAADETEPGVGSEIAVVAITEPEVVVEPELEVMPEPEPELRIAPEPVAEAEAEPVPAPETTITPSVGTATLSSRQARAIRPTFTLDPLHPASQLLRGLSLDYDNDPFR
jgi:Histidine kinase-, DNA gyrase B-, and HSP90-like ATPase